VNIRELMTYVIGEGTRDVTATILRNPSELVRQLLIIIILIVEPKIQGLLIIIIIF
jgi:hypothetical protein